MTVKTRFAPSPTGYLHIGGARTALFSWLYARRHGGSFVLRIEDTDRERSSDEAVNAILEGMSWLGLDYDEGPFYQTGRFDRYKVVIEQLLAEGKAYYCYCTRERLEKLREEQMARKEKPRYDRCCINLSERPENAPAPVVRFRNPDDGGVVIDDRVRGRVVYSNTELDDLIIARGDGTPTYNFTVVVDDTDMGITHVIRGDDHLNNTPRQMNIMRALGHEPPVYAHVPMILDEEGKKLSKRTGAASVMEYRDKGYMPEAVINYLVRLGWSHGDQEIFGLDEMVNLFDIDDINASASRLNPGKLGWLNEHYLKSLPVEHVARHLSHHLGEQGIDPATGPDVLALTRVQRERCKTLAELAEQSVVFYRDFDAYDEKAARKNFKGEALTVLKSLRSAFAELAEWDGVKLHELVQLTAERLELKLGKVAQPLRVAVMGGPVSPSIDATLDLLGREKTLARLDRAIAHIESAEQG
ncbi:glutamate--tRNA ligase [Alkalilimnicola sp. S0819]|uniref:glutamate--tRNA ligase n=1 Tax=Alkalilimnicola sp. S0819 TaxID=2613922 RepID=UPI0012621B63|nr:glutamate--tRNA ligase [Alkalilimnicola sp. S0819]KAB7627208.1 glutamate--tRNA ligase [Alkalilimnicola sp. S0819]MPQ15921.1 glutamate--tRNA ligase [Alkalilimnicola sp. S0819]